MINLSGFIAEAHEKTNISITNHLTAYSPYIFAYFSSMYFKNG